MAVVPPNPIIPRLAEALGLNPKKCRSLSLRASINDAVMVTADEYADERQLENVIKCFTKRDYTLVYNAWASVSDFLPKDETWCWVRDKDGIEFIAMRSRSAAGGWTNLDTWEDFQNEVTHWIALQSPPKHG